jgi:hypothetical protein
VSFNEPHKISLSFDLCTLVAAHWADLAIIKSFFIFVENLKICGPNVPKELGKNSQSEIWGQSW